MYYRWLYLPHYLDSTVIVPYGSWKTCKIEEFYKFVFWLGKWLNFVKNVNYSTKTWVSLLLWARRQGASILCHVSFFSLKTNGNFRNFLVLSAGNQLRVFGPSTRFQELLIPRITFLKNQIQELSRIFKYRRTPSEPWVIVPHFHTPLHFYKDRRNPG